MCHIYTMEYSVQFSHSVVYNSLQPHGQHHARLPSPSVSPRVCSNSCPLKWWCYPTISPSVNLLPSIFPSIRVFFSESSLCIRWLKYWNVSISPSNEYSGLIPLGLTGLISLLSKGLSRVFSLVFLSSKASILSTLGFLYDPTLTSVHDYWKNHSLDYTDLCWQNDGSTF